MRAIIAAAVMSLALAAPAHATSNLSCTATGEGFAFSVEGIMGMEDWVPVENLDVQAELSASRVPEGLRSIQMKDALAQRWIGGGLIKLQFHKTIDTDAATATADVKVETAFDEESEEMNYKGTYHLAVSIEPKNNSLEALSLVRDGAATCQLQ
jgi:hypothetical protein